MPFTLTPKNSAISLPARMGSLLVRYRGILILRDGSQVILAALLLTALFAWLDWRYALPPLVRAAALTITLTVPCLLAWIRIISPWRRQNNCLTMACRVERQFPEFNDSLISAVQFLEIPKERQFGSSALRRESIEYATAYADEFDFNEAVPSTGTKRSLFALFVALVGAAVVFGYARGESAQALARLLLPFGTNEWPAKTHVQILSPQSFPHQIAKRDWFEMRFRITGLVPDRAVVTIWEDGGRPTDQAYAIGKAEQASGEANLPIRLEPDRIEKSFRVRIRANDADTGFQRVEVHAPPVLVPRDGRPSPQIQLTYPSYTGLPALELPDGGSVIETITGTRVRIKAAADRPVAKARLVGWPLQHRWPIAAFLSALGDRNGLDASANLALGREIWNEIPVQLSHDGLLIDIDFVPRLPGQYMLRIEDETGIGSERTFDVRIDLDPSPKVLLFRPSRRDAVNLVPEADFNIAALATDEKFALRQVFLEYRTSPSQTFRRIDLFDTSIAAHVLPFLTTAIYSPLHLPVSPFPTLHAYGLDRNFPVARFSHPDGSPLKIGDVLTLRIGANDFDNVTVNKPAGYSETIDLPIVAKAQVDAVLQQGLAQVREELLLLRDLQKEARQKVQNALESIEQSGNLTRVEQIQQQIAAKLKSPDDGLLARTARMQQAVNDNRLPRSRTTERIDAVAADLMRLAREELDPLEKFLEKARKDVEKNQAQPSLVRVERHQQEVEDTLRALLDRLEPWSGAGEARGEARSLFNELRKQLEMLDRLQQNQTPNMAGGKREDLPDAMRNELDRSATGPERAADRVRQLLDKIEQLAEAKAAAAKQQPVGKEDMVESIKAEEEALRNAVKQANGPELRKRLQAAPGQIRDNQLGEAKKNLQSAAGQIAKLVEALEEKQKAADVDRLQKNRKETDARLDKLIDDQERLRKKVEAAKQISEPMLRADELRKLSRDQEQLQKDAQDLVKQLTRNGDEAAAQQLRRAARQMDDARQQLDQGQAPDMNQDDALDRLDDAKELAEREQKQNADELIREKLAKETDLLKGIRDRQAAALEEEKRLQTKVLQDRKWDASVARNSLPALIDQQEALAKELRNLIEKRFNGDPVFARMLRQAADAMDAAVKRLNERKEDVLDQLEGVGSFDPELEAKADRAIRNWQELALKRMDQLLEALKPDPAMKPPPQPKKDPAPMKMDDPPKEKDKPAHSLPPLAELKALRSLQADIVERTAAFDTAHPDRTKLTLDEIAELKAIEKAQIDIAELVLELASSAVEGK